MYNRHFKNDPNAFIPNEKKPELISYQAMRKAIGFLAMLLPFVLIIGARIFGNCTVLQPSISHYYYTNMHDIFVGAFCAMSLFMFSYKGYTKCDSRAANLAGFFGLGNALIPCEPICDKNGFCYYCQSEFRNLFFFKGHESVHYVFAALFLATFAYMSLFLFTKSNYSEDNQSRQKRKRNIVYKVSGITIVISAISVFLAKKLFHVQEKSTLTFYLETLATVSFGFSWLTKGELFFPDKK